MTSEPNDDKFSRGLPFYIESTPRKVRDPSIPEHVDGWKGCSEATFKLLEGLESLRDLKVVLSDLVAQDQPHLELRRIKRISTPLYSLAWSVINICDELINNPNSYGGRTDECEKSVRDWKQEMERVVPLSGDSTLRKVRNKIDAHIDSGTVMNPESVWEHVTLENYVPWLGCTITAYKHMLVLNVYGWTCESSHPDIWRLMSVDGMLVDFFMENGQPSFITSATQTISPKVDIARDLNEIITIYNSLLGKLPSTFFPNRDAE